jgi:hypothetical protein
VRGLSKDASLSMDARSVNGQYELNIVRGLVPGSSAEYLLCGYAAEQGLEEHGIPLTLSLSRPAGEGMAKPVSSKAPLGSFMLARMTLAISRPAGEGRLYPTSG